MIERPILLSGPMVRAILDGRKTQTRRIVKQPIGDALTAAGVEHLTRCPYGAPGDRLWVRETWAARLDQDHIPPRDLPRSSVGYWADGPSKCCNTGCAGAAGKVRPSIHMPRWASRLTLEIVSVRVERLQEISEADAVAEGFEARPFPGPWWQGYRDVDGELLHQQHVGDAPPDWMIEPKRMRDHKHLDLSAIDEFRALWWQINGAESWASNPFVWVIEFRRLP